MTLRPISVLLVEDEQLVAQDLQQTLSELGYDAFGIASSATEALQLCSERCPDIVLMDIRIKGELDGIATAKILLERFGVAIIYLTAHTDGATLERAKHTTPYAYLVKPVRPSELQSAIEVAYYKHRLEQQKHEHFIWNQATLYSMGDAVVTVDLAGNVTFLNKAAEELVGLTQSKALGKPSSQVLQLVDHEDPLARALQEKQTINFYEMWLRNQSTGEERSISDSSAPVYSGDKVLGAVMVFRDVTNKKELQRKQELSDRLASLGTMAAGVAHEINNPLASVMGNIEHVLSELEQILPADADVLLAMRDVQVATQRISRIVSDLRSFARPPQLQSGAVDLALCVETACRTTSHQVRHRAQLVTSLRPVPPVYAEETRLVQVIINLILNASQAMKTEDPTENKIQVRTFVSPDGRAVVEIEDNGSGMSDATLKRIFDPFFTTKDVGQGTGLGLSICHGIVASLEGELTVKSSLGVGTVFRVSLPPSTLNTQPANPNKLTSITSKKIIVIDDEPSIQLMLVRMFRGNEVCPFTHAEDALTFLQQGQAPDAIFCDLEMHKMNGAQFYERLLSQSPELANRVAFISGGALTPSLSRFAASMKQPLIPKPFRREQILQCLEGLLTLHKT